MQYGGYPWEDLNGHGKGENQCDEKNIDREAPGALERGGLGSPRRGISLKNGFKRGGELACSSQAPVKWKETRLSVPAEKESRKKTDGLEGGGTR